VSLLEIDAVSLAFGPVPLLDAVSFRLEPGERVCLLGRNGAGKSTLLGVLSGGVSPDRGRVWRQPGLRVASLAQDVPTGDERTVYHVVADGLGSIGELAAAYHDAAHRVGTDHAPDAIAALGDLQAELDRRDGWHLERRVEQVIERLGLQGDLRVHTLSGGLRRRVMLARALVSEPDVLLLDEPTNHLDVASIEWLERFLLDFRGAILFVTHDRSLLRAVATRIVELERGTLRSYPGRYETYLERREAEAEALAAAEARFDKVLAREEVWIRQGIKARRTRDEGRVRALEAMRRERATRRAAQGTVHLAIDDGWRSGAVVFEMEAVTHGFGGPPVITEFSTRIMRGDRVGILGPNGSGKTTLLRLLVGEIAPQQGTVRRGTNLEIAYFDQERVQLDPDRTVMDTLADGRQMVSVGGSSRHVAGYLKDFLFAADQLQSPVRALSGGERNRLLLARLFAQPANLLILDEPTNDLDLETLDVVEDVLLTFAGTLLVVSHDRTFLDRVVTSTIAFEGGGAVREYVGGYAEWVRQRPAAANPETTVLATGSAPRTGPTSPPSGTTPRKLTWAEQRELEQLPARITSLEARKADLEGQIADVGFHLLGAVGMAQVAADLADVEQQLDVSMTRWLDLESRAGQAGKG
jgi:ABC transport system ATP-binding/permease protein